MCSLEVKILSKTTIDYPNYMYQIAFDNSELFKSCSLNDGGEVMRDPVYLIDQTSSRSSII